MTSMRNRGGLLVGIIGFAIVAFLVGDVIVSGRNIFGNGQNQIGKVNGETIEYTAFQAKLDENTEAYKKNSGSSDINPTMTGYLVDQTWNQMVQDIILKKSIAVSGVGVSADELFDMIQGKNPHPEVRRAFANPQTGVFDPSQVVTFLKNLDTQDPTGATKKQWLAFEKAINEERIRQKYFNLVKGAMYTPTAFAKANFTEQNKTANISYVMLDYASIPDNAIKVTESDMSTYYNANKYKYAQKENARSFDYIYVDVLPSAEDSAAIKKSIDEQLVGLQTTTNDSTYIALNADTKFAAEYAKRGTLAGSLDTVMFSKPEGYIMGPYIDGGAYKIAKLMSIKSLPDSVRARHILIKATNENAMAMKAKADSLKKLIDAGADFATLAQQYSEDGTKDKGGDLGYFDNKQMVKPFSDFCFKGTKGEMKVVGTQFGFHIVQITDQKNFEKQVLVGVIDRKIEPSSQTSQALYTKINEVLAGVTDAKAFAALKLGNGLNKRVAENIKENDRFVAGLDNPRELIRWAYKAEKGDVSTLFEIGNKYVFANLTQIKEKGTVAQEYLKNELEAAVRQEKKAAQLTEKLLAASTGASNMQQIAQKAGAQAQVASGLNFAFPVIPGISREPEVVGNVFAMAKGKISKPIVGGRGVYVVSVDNFVEAMQLPDYNAKKSEMASIAKSRVDQELMEALKNKADIKDNRVRFY
ncbi:MAG: hypothetical protein RI952_823 [Bacteroidota bacterium]